jgi:hypothetical protein
MRGRHAGLAIHVGADSLTDPRHAGFAPLPSSRDTIESASRLASAAGISRQHQLAGASATRERVSRALASATTELDPHGQLLLTFTGHSDRGEPDASGRREISWCLRDGTLGLAEVAALLRALPSTAMIVVVADTCYAAALSAFAMPAPLVLLAACGAGQQILARPAVTFTALLEQLVLPGGRPNPDCASYLWLDRRLRHDTPDVERPRVWASHAIAWTERPFQPRRTTRARRPVTSRARAGHAPG